MLTSHAHVPREPAGRVLSRHRPGLIESRCAQLGIEYEVHYPAPLGQRRRVLERLFAR